MTSNGDEGGLEKVIDVVRAVSSAIYGILQYAFVIQYPIPVGLVVTVGVALYRRFHRELTKNPFKLPVEKLREYLAEARVEEEKLSRELRDIERLIRRVEAGEIKVEEEHRNLLNAKRRQLEEAVKLAREKVMLTEMAIMVKENVELFNQLFGRDRFERLLDPEELSKLMDKEVLRMVESVDVGSLHTYFNQVFPLILRNPEGFRAEVRPEQPPQPPPRPGYVPLELVDRLAKEGSVEDWVDLIRRSLETGERVRLPPGRYVGREGYRNLIRALYLLLETEKPSKLKEVVEDRFLSRAVDYLKQLRSGVVEVAPDSSDAGYLDDLLQITCGDPVREERTESEVVRQYKLQLGGRAVTIERRVVKDPATGRAQKVVYRVIS